MPRRLYTRIYLHFLGVLIVVTVVMRVMWVAHGVHPRGPLWLFSVLVLVAVATAPLARRISRPVEHLTLANQRFGAGELDYRIDVPRCMPRRRHDDEMLRLMTSWNDMAQRISDLLRGQRELLANVSHELRSPLARVRVALALLPEDPELSRRVADIESDLGELERLIDDVLTAAQLDAARLPLRRARVRARQQILEALRERATQPVTLAAGEEVELEADPALLKRALWNLLENAFKYGAPPVELALERRGERAVFSVSDAGPGIAAEERERVLQPFYQTDKARTPSARHGVGLGLTLALRIAQAHGGGLAVREGRAGRGCRVELWVPTSGSPAPPPGTR